MNDANSLISLTIDTTPPRENERRDHANILRGFRRSRPRTKPKMPAWVPPPPPPRQRTAAERSETAWQLLLRVPGMTQAETEAASGASGGTINEQRRVLKRLQQQWADAGPHSDLPSPMSMTWAEARVAAKDAP